MCSDKARIRPPTAKTLFPPKTVKMPLSFMEVMMPHSFVLWFVPNNITDHPLSRMSTYAKERIEKQCQSY